MRRPGFLFYVLYAFYLCERCIYFEFNVISIILFLKDKDVETDIEEK